MVSNVGYKVQPIWPCASLNNKKKEEKKKESKKEISTNKKFDVRV